MMTQKRINAGILLLMLNMYAVLISFAQDVPPLVYDVEFTGVDCTKPPLPTIDELPTVKPLTDPFEWSDGSGRDTSFASWVCRRAEIKAEIENYEIGPKPDRPDTISASYENDTLKINITVNGNTLTLTSVITLPEGDGPFPAVIGIGFGTGSLPADIFTSRNIAQIPFYFWEVMAWDQVRGQEPINKLYPDLTYMGAYCAWSWGISRLIDGLELVSEDLPIDLEHLAITGCSFAGKMALFGGAFDERIALTIAQESGGGGAAAWRVSETITESVETLGSTSHIWFMESMFQFAAKNVSKLPHDHHELMAMVAPRALLVIGNPAMVWLAEESGYTSCEAAKLVWQTFGIPDRFGFSFVAHSDHCGLPDVQKPEVEAFVDKFLLGDITANTNISTHIYDYVIPSYWTDWWGTGDPDFAVLDRGESDEVWFEAECATVGEAWNVRLDTLASNESYVIPKPGLRSTVEAPTDSGASIYFPFTVNTDSKFYLYGHVNNPGTTRSYWLKLDDGSFKKIYSTYTNEWEWKELTTFNLTAGEHTLVLTYREEGIKLDKICISEFHYPPGKLGEPAEFICEPDTTTKFYSAIDEVDEMGAYTLGQNYPNPLDNNTTIDFEIPCGTYVSLKVYSILGEEVAELAGKEYTPGKHTVKFDAQNLSRGVYFYTFKADKFSASRKMIIQIE